MSGAKAARPGLAQAMEVARANDVVAVWRLDRLGRSLHDLIILARTLDDARDRADEPQGEDRYQFEWRKKLIFHMFGALAEFGRNLVRERTQAGLSAARARGRKGGRPKTPRSGQTETCCPTLRREATHDRRDLPDDGDFEADPLQLPVRSPVTCGASGHRTRPWWLCETGSNNCRKDQRSGWLSSRDCADLHGVSIDTIYRSLREQFRPRALHRRDRGVPRKLSRKEMEHLCEVIAAVKLRTPNLKRRHLSTGGAIDLLIDPGIETPDGLLRIEPDALTRSTVNRYLRAWGMDDRHIQQPPPAVRFQADNSNDCWQFDLSPSDLKQVPAPLWIEEGRVDSHAHAVQRGR